MADGPVASPVTSLASVLYNEKNFNLISSGKTYITIKDINDAIVNPDIKGDLAAAVAVLKIYETQIVALIRQNGGAPTLHKTGFNYYLTRESLLNLDQVLKSTSLDDLIAFKFVPEKILTKYNNARETINKQDPRLDVGDADLTAIKQGVLNDCAFLSALMSQMAVAKKPEVTDNKNGTYTVKFAGMKNGVTVKTPTASEVALYASSGRNGLWVTIIEKAYCKAEQNIFNKLLAVSTHTPPQDKYKTQGEATFISIKLLTGHEALSYSAYSAQYFTGWKGAAIKLGLLDVKCNTSDAIIWGKIIDGTTNKQIMVAGSSYYKTVMYTPPDSFTPEKVQIPSGHAFAVLGINPKNGRIIVQNPANLSYAVGKRTEWLPSEFAQAFDIFSIEEP